jgi:hypothetical protein
MMRHMIFTPRQMLYYWTDESRRKFACQPQNWLWRTAGVDYFCTGGWAPTHLSKSPLFKGREGPSPCPQELAIGPYLAQLNPVFILTFFFLRSVFWQFLRRHFFWPRLGSYSPHVLGLIDPLQRKYPIYYESIIMLFHFNPECGSSALLRNLVIHC